MKFDIQHIAIHLIDRDLDDPVLAEHEIDVERDFKKEDHRAVVADFLQRHLGTIWDDGKADDASLSSTSVVRGIAQSLFAEKPAGFLEQSKKLARLLHQEQRKRARASRGLLLVMQCTPTGQPARKHLAMIKLDPGDRDLLTLQRRNGQILLELAVEHVDLALPEPGAALLKWAIVPHPADRRIGAKLRDKQNADNAAYFLTFLSATTRPKDPQAIEIIEDSAIQAIADQHPDVPLQKEKITEATEEIAEELGKGGEVSAEKVAKVYAAKTGLAIETQHVKKPLKQAGITKPVKAQRPEEVPDHWVTWRLDNEVSISGRASVLKKQVKRRRLQSGVIEFTTRATSYDTVRSGKRGR